MIAKYAMSIDGKLATHNGDSKWLTGEAARENVHRWRRKVDAILVGSQTAMQDNPQLTVRLSDTVVADTEQPLRIILDGKHAIPKNIKLFSSELPGKTLLASEVVKQHGQQIDLDSLLMELYKLDINSLIVEGGAQTLTQFFAADLVDEIHCYIAAKLVGGATAPTAYMGMGVELMSEATPFALQDVQKFADDVLLIYRRNYV